MRDSINPRGETRSDGAPFDTELQFIRVGPHRLRTIDVGRGRPIAFVHGTPTWSYEWRHLIAGLRDSRRCLAVDHLGFGFSDRPADADYRPEAHAARFRSWFDALDLDEATIVLHDFGGPIALPTVLDARHRFRELVLLNTFGFSLTDDRATMRAARWLGGRVGRWLYRRVNFSPRVILPMAYAKRARLSRDTHARYLERFPDPDSRERVLWSLAKALVGSDAFFRSIDARLSELSELRVVIGWGMRDPAFTVEYLRRWRERFPAAHVHEFADAGHWPHEEQPDAVLSMLRSVES